MNILKIVLSLLVVFAFSLPASANKDICPEGESQGRELNHWDPINGSTTICPHPDGLQWCCYDPC